MVQHYVVDQRRDDSSRRVLELSEREREVLEWLPTHLSNAEIGRQVHMSVNTVKSHLKAIYLALGVRSRSEAVEVAGLLGLLSDRCHRCGQRSAPSEPSAGVAAQRRVS